MKQISWHSCLLITESAVFIGPIDRRRPQKTPRQLALERGLTDSTRFSKFIKRLQADNQIGAWRMIAKTTRLCPKKSVYFSQIAFRAD
ncbi:MAG: hypothetical protein EBZ14_06335 [Gammaproteobacteria bacterium]|nr:hypothetical protein [Gammaproteobacteria bacterium]